MKDGLARIAGSYRASSKQPHRLGTQFARPGHPYAADLDLFGAGSLFERLDVAHTPAGEARLAEWLLAPAGAETIAARQAGLRSASTSLFPGVSAGWLHKSTARRAGFAPTNSSEEPFFLPVGWDQAAMQLLDAHPIPTYQMLADITLVADTAILFAKWNALVVAARAPQPTSYPSNSRRE